MHHFYIARHEVVQFPVIAFDSHGMFFSHGILAIRAVTKTKAANNQNATNRMSIGEKSRTAHQTRLKTRRRYGSHRSMSVVVGYQPSSSRSHSAYVRRQGIS